MSNQSLSPIKGRGSAEAHYRGQKDWPMSKWKQLTHAEQMELDKLLDERPGMASHLKGDPNDKTWGKSYTLTRRSSQSGDR